MPDTAISVSNPPEAAPVETNVAEPPKPAAAASSGTAPVAISIAAPGQTFQYAEPTLPATLEQLREEILKGTIPHDAPTTIATRLKDGKVQTVEGPLLRLSSRYKQLAALYTPIRRYSIAGVGYGCLTGVIIALFNLGIAISRVNNGLGLAFIGTAISLVVFPLLEKNKVKVGFPFSLIPLVLPGYIGLEGGFAMGLGAVCAGALLGCMPGMAIGAIVGAVRRPRLTLAYDAPRENALLRILIPALIAVAIWTAYFYLMFHYLFPFLMNRP